VTLRRPQRTATLKVGKDVRRFDELKKGDEVVVRHTEAFAIKFRQQSEIFCMGDKAESVNY
jgi:hypothetical protein